MVVAKNEKRRQEPKIIESDFCHLGKQKSKPPTQIWKAIDYFISSQELRDSPTSLGIHKEIISKIINNFKFH